MHCWPIKKKIQASIVYMKGGNGVFLSVLRAWLKKKTEMRGRQSSFTKTPKLPVIHTVPSFSLTPDGACPVEELAFAKTRCQILQLRLLKLSSLPNFSSPSQSIIGGWWLLSGSNSQRGLIVFMHSWLEKVWPWSHERADPPITSKRVLIIDLPTASFSAVVGIQTVMINLDLYDTAQTVEIF